MKLYICTNKYKWINKGEIVELSINTTNGIGMIIIDNYFKSFILVDEIYKHFKDVVLHRKEQLEKL